MTLVLRRLVVDDAAELARWATDRLLCAHAGWTVAKTPTEALAWWRNAIDHPSPGLLRQLAVRDGKPVGYVDLAGEDARTRELGYVIAPSTLWGQGLGTAAGHAGLQYGFTELDLDRIWAETAQANEASVRVLERLGMRRLGVGDPTEFLGAPSRYVQFELLSTDWRLERQTQ